MNLSIADSCSESRSKCFRVLSASAAASYVSVVKMSFLAMPPISDDSALALP